jgi:predicted RNase H-like HicB family nuclease
LTESYILEYFIPSTKTKSLDWVKINYTAIIYEVNMHLKLTKIFKKVPEGYVGFVQELPGANTQAETLEEARENLEEAIELVLESNRLLAEEQLQGQDVIREPIFLSVA